MQLFNCICGETSSLFFESTQCIACGRLTGFCHDSQSVISFDTTKTNDIFKAAGSERLYRQCDNYAMHHACNGMIAVTKDTRHKKPEENLCFGCHFNDNIPDLSVPQHLHLWQKLEIAKRRTLYTLDKLQLPLLDKEQDPIKGLSFDFLADKNASDHFSTPLDGQDPVFTGHNNGHITINIAEADDVARASTRLALGERYRTLLGHFRHEIGHYYWDVLVANSPEQTALFRKHFGDEREDYQTAIKRHYKEGAPKNWQNSFISEYATMHPWEDFAESWAHYLHMIDTLETAQAFGLRMTPQTHTKDLKGVSELTLPQADMVIDEHSTLTEIINTWIRFSVILNSLNRSMGQPDAYPFIFNAVIGEKLQFIHDLIHSFDTETPINDQPEQKKGS